MSRWRVIVVSSLIALPFLTWVALGSYYLWTLGLTFVVWWPMAGCFILGYVLAWHWQRKQQLLRPVVTTPPKHWTARDLQAWKLVEERAAQAPRLDPNQLSTFQFYADLGQAMALELARFYHPNARDPIASLTIPEILAVVELVSHDLAELVDQYLPGGHLLTVQDWRRAKWVSDWYQTASNIYWLASALISPLTTGARYVASKAGMSRPLELLQKNLLAWFYVAFVNELGSYLIELNSGRLRVGAQRYRELKEGWSRPGVEQDGAGAGTPPAGEALDPADQIGQIALTVVGQVKAGKSSLINALLGEQRAATDVLPLTNQVTRYDLHHASIPTRLILFDTMGYGHTGPLEDQLAATEEAARQSDLIVLVMHARNPARQADVELLRGLRAWFNEHPEVKMPPVLGVLTHIDLLSPSLEWAPPYNWIKPRRPKEQQISQAWSVVRQQLGDYLVGVVPVCTGPGKVYGIEEWLLPTIAELLDEAHGVALLRCIRAEANTAKVRKVFEQLLETGKLAARVVLETYLRQMSFGSSAPAKSREDRAS